MHLLYFIEYIINRFNYNITCSHERKKFKKKIQEYNTNTIINICRKPLLRLTLLLLVYDKVISLSYSNVYFVVRMFGRWD